ncbi:Acetyltransferase (GNAT) family protein [Gluconobacter japonicus]|nr:Acetyltransferase (GNAT) family protein [Gluconobacter japonicus]
MNSRVQKQSFQIRDARLKEVEQLQTIEISAAQSFRSVPALNWIAASDAMSADTHRRSIRTGTCWVAVNTVDTPVGFLTAFVDRNDVHILEMSVASPWQRCGIGKALLQHLTQWALREKLTCITLTTFQEVPWNAPFYSKMGFVILLNKDLDQRLVSVLDREHDQGFPKGSRCAMRFDLKSIAHKHRN